MKKLRENKKGFTLIEMIVVIVIIAILAAIAVPAVMKYIDEARETKYVTHASSAKTAVEAELAKFQAKSTDGKFTTTGDTNNLKTAVETVAGVGKDVEDVKNIDICKTATDTACTKADAAMTLKDIKGYVIEFNDGKFVFIKNDGSAEVLTSFPTPA